MQNASVRISLPKRGRPVRDQRKDKGRNLFDTGHAFVSTPAHVLGFYPSDPFLVMMNFPGKLVDDTAHAWDKEIRFKLCPESMAKINDWLEKQKNLPKQPVYRFDRLQCATWACLAFAQAGIDVPFPAPPNIPGRDQPYPTEPYDLGQSPHAQNNPMGNGP
jgi:hypothetical protein